MDFIPPADLAAIKQRAIDIAPVKNDAEPGGYHPDRRYWHPLQAPLAAWYVYVDEPLIGCRILIVAKDDSDRMPGESVDFSSWLRAIPVKTVLRHPWFVRSGYIIADIPMVEVGPPPGDPFGRGERVPEQQEGDVEYRPLPACWCVFFTGIQNETCCAGIVYSQLSPRGFGSALRLPCVASNHWENLDGVVECASLRWPTQEELVEHEQVMEEAVELFAERLTQGLCVECGQKPTRMRQVHQSYYAEPCGHRQGVGSAKAWNARFAAVSSDEPPEAAQAHLDLE